MGVTKYYEIVKSNWALEKLAREERFYLESQLLPTWHSGKEAACQGRRCKRRGFEPWIRKIPLEEKMANHSGSLDCKNSMDREAWGLQSMGSQRVRHD